MTSPPGRTISALWRSCHPGPSLVVTALAAALAIAAEIELWRTVLLTLAVFAGQLFVGFSNDAFDARRDREVGRDDKPLARGEITVHTVWVAALFCLLLALGLSAPLGVGLLTAHALALASAWSYNATLKATAFSIAPFILSFGLFPSFATLTAEPSQFAPMWAWVAGGAFGAAVHLTNVLPDLDDDARTGIRGLPHRLGVRPSVVLAATAVIAGAIAVLIGPAGAKAAEVNTTSWLFFGLISAVALLAVALAFAGRSSRILFRLIMLAGLLLAAHLVTTGNAFAG
ncbi:UbiA family prenyltransferase [Bogoriella caseilytica]|uniref:4-hydroxybenzoate polyprenyltransferase n=1 Tax=Bogoriella caseilytica TaxID=56055 RepID=A0A3N2BH88_9MICO|nr:UbiA family prenyltransferase [Bogoriella caseilytica]ROR74434.1 4-hydroxybenzoate polyprenyltransferase [Bogoriella caseilytica]